MAPPKILAARAPIRRSPRRVAAAQVRLVAAIGADAQGERIRSNLAAEGVLTDGLATSSYGTDRCVITVDGQGENTILSLIDAARNFDPIAETSVARWIMPGDWVVMQGNLRPNVTRDCLALAKSKGATTALNPSPTYRRSATTTGRLVDLVVVNRGEAIELAGGGAEEASRGRFARRAQARSFLRSAPTAPLSSRPTRHFA